MSFIDASVMVAILLQEPGAESLAARLDADAESFTNAIAVWETATALHRKKNLPIDKAETYLAEFLAAANIEVCAVAPADVAPALSAFALYGRHRYLDPGAPNKGLNLADCFHYASAKSRRASIVTLDEGFAVTDLPKGD